MIIKNDTRTIPDKAFTHGAIFHADDVFSAALLKTLNPNIEIERGFKVPQNYDGLVFDIGFGEFDHHQKDNDVRENGVPYASFGKLWQAFGHRLVGQEGVENIDKNLIQAMDLTDNTAVSNPLSMVILSQNPSWVDDSPDYDACFNKAVDMAQSILASEIKKERDLELAKNLAKTALEKAPFKELIIMKKYAPITPYLSDTKAHFVIFPSSRGGYEVKAVPLPGTENTPKKPMPKSWAGKEEGLSEISNIDSLRFCHSGGWMCAANTLEGAVKAALLAYTGQEKWTREMDQALDYVMPKDTREIDGVDMKRNDSGAKDRDDLTTNDKFNKWICPSFA